VIGDAHDRGGNCKFPPSNIAKIHNCVTPDKIMAQMGMFVPARSARYVFQYEKQACLSDSHFRLCPVDAILTRMGAYDNMFSNSSTFKVELDEW
jgi:hypothetical protein